MEAAAHYRKLVRLGRAGFLAAAAPAVLVRMHATTGHDAPDEITETLDEDLDDPDITAMSERVVLPDSRVPRGELGGELDVYPLVKKPGASFADRITIGRTPNNDITIIDHSVSRLHAYVRRAEADAWVVADAGSKNGSWLAGEPLPARRERPVASRAVIRLGELSLLFYVAADLFGALGGV